MSKTAAWWQKDWMERHTYFLPRYDASGRMVAAGHVLAAAPGIACLMRRTYKHATEPAPPGAYDFINYFECADGDVPTFHQVSAALRDVAANPEWQFVREGPTWHGRRVAAWADLFA
jgi:crotonobetainyl-CoA:carnitine CoA-transferase CaiB-like acyl-CoA transferase